MVKKRAVDRGIIVADKRCAVGLTMTVGPRGAKQNSRLMAHQSFVARALPPCHDQSLSTTLTLLFVSL